ncbi:MAG: putative transcriptional regulator [Rubrobacteraceae bacterium]|jgi:GntR family transcriptional regulator|nr:putative transcriptional regulator [Rubrobacteraceae bacterium]
MSSERAQPKQPRIPLHLSMDDPEPMYRQIESQLRDFILSGQLEPGTRLPSMRALAKDLLCSVITTRRAYEDLEGEGFIRTRQGMGTVVAEIPEETMAAYRREAVDGAMGEAVRAGRRAGLTEEELRDILEETLQREVANVHQGGTP